MRPEKLAEPPIDEESGIIKEVEAMKPPKKERKAPERMPMDSSVPVLPVTVSAGGYGFSGEKFCAADSAAHVLNADVVTCGQNAILSKLASQDALDNVRETLKSECALQHAIAEVKHASSVADVRAAERECETRRHITYEAQTTRELINLDIRRRDDREIADLRLKLELCKCGCGCSGSGVGNGNGNGNGNG